MRLPDMVEHPHYTLPLLEILKDDPVLYVRRSVANHMGDILKDHPKVAYAVLEKWLEESFFQEDEEGDRRRWIIRHALRLPARKGDVRALRIRKNAAR
jgi:3-methyladenine DNA glycosylase AlkC